MNARRTRTLFILLIAASLGALREFLFINLNYQIDYLGNHRSISYAHSLFRGWVQGVDLSGLMMVKWVLALAFIGATLALGILMAWVRFGDHRYARLLVLAFGLLGSLALLFHWGADRIPGLSIVSVTLLHLLQYPVVLVVIWAASRLAPVR